MGKIRPSFRRALFFCAVRVQVAACFAASAQETGFSDRTDTAPAHSCIVHVHTAMSSGRYSLPELTDVARRYGVDAIFLSDSLSASVQYGMPPLRHMFWVSRSLPSVRSLGPKRYLAEIEKENKRQSDVLYIPGVEICPRYYWTGSIFRGSLTCHDLQRNLIALGTYDAKTLIGMPETAGYIRGRDTGWIVLSRALPAAFAVASAALLLLRRAQARRRRLLRFGIAWSLLCVAALNMFASLSSLFDIYGAGGTDQAAQRVIDYLEQRGIPHYWAHPEESDRNELVAFGQKIGIRTDPYPEMPAATRGHSGFGGVYESRNTLFEPDNQWDAILGEYAGGTRGVSAWCFGEMLYHYEGQAGKKLGNVETMVWADRKTPQALLDSIRRGRFYARQNTAAQSLSIRQWLVRPAPQSTTGSEKEDKTPPAESGGMLESNNRTVEAVLEVSSKVPGEQVLVRVIRDGAPIKSENLTTPFRLAVADSLPAGDARHYYRAVVNGKYPLVLVTNPIFARPNE